MQRENRQIVLLHKAAAADAHALYLIRYEAYLAQYGTYGSSDCPCVQSEEQFLEQIKQENTYRITAGGVTVGITNTEHLNSVVARLKKIKDVVSVTRN